MELTLRTPGDPPSDATNYLGGVADVLEDKAHRGTLDHLDDLAGFGIYNNDRQVREVHFRHEESRPSGYTLQVWALETTDGRRTQP